MGFTDNCDIFASFHQDGLNQILKHVWRQRPSLFNYATADVVASLTADTQNHQGLLCKPITAHELFFDTNPDSPFKDQPLVTIEDPLPIPGTDFGINFAAQVVDLQIDFHPGADFNLPQELNPPLKAHRWAGKVSLCAGIGCPKDEVIDSLNADSPRVLPADELLCFCLDAFITGGIRIITDDAGKFAVEPFMDGFEIVDIAPKELESNLECWIGLLLKLSVLPGLRILLTDAAFNLTQDAPEFFPKPTNVTIRPTPVSAALPNNPAIEADQLKIFIKVEVA